MELSDVVGFVCLLVGCRALGTCRELATISGSAIAIVSKHMLLFTKKMLGSGQIQESYRGAVSPLLGDLITATAY